MNNDERKHRYAMMGVISYVQERVEMAREDGKDPKVATLGKLEWEEILRSNPDEEFTIAGLPCVPDFTKPHGVFFDGVQVN